MADYYTSLPDSVFSDIAFLAELAMVGTWTPWKYKDATNQFCDCIDLKII